MLGVLAWQRGQYEMAHAYLRQALRLQPDLAGAHINLGNLLKAQGKLASDAEFTPTVDDFEATL